MLYVLLYFVPQVCLPLTPYPSHPNPNPAQARKAEIAERKAKRVASQVNLPPRSS